MHLWGFRRAGIQIWDLWMLKMSDTGNHNESSPIPNSVETVIPKPSKPCVTYQVICDIFDGHLNKILNLQRNMGWYQYNTASIWDNIRNGESHWRYICNKKLQVAVFRHHPTWKGTENGANINIYWKQCFQSTSGTSWSIEIIVLPEVSPYCRSWK